MCYAQMVEEQEHHHTSEAEWDRAGAREMGAYNRDQAWILSDRDVWYENPYYQGPPVPHPEDDYQYEEIRAGMVDPSEEMMRFIEDELLDDCPF